MLFFTSLFRFIKLCDWGRRGSFTKKRTSRFCFLGGLNEWIVLVGRCFDFILGHIQVFKTVVSLEQFLLMLTAGFKKRIGVKIMDNDWDQTLPVY